MRVRDYLQRAVGMAMLGDTSESAFFVLHGETGCGKSVFFEVMASAFGDFAATAAASTFRESKDESSRRANDLHELRGARFVSTSETSERTQLNEELVKRVTGGDKVTSHALFQSNVTWKPQFTMFMATNFKPTLTGDNAIWRRVKPIHFPNKFYNSNGTATENREAGLSDGSWRTNCRDPELDPRRCSPVPRPKACRNRPHCARRSRIPGGDRSGNPVPE